MIYPFIINNPGEGAQAKRRAHAIIVDHLVPPMTSAGAYGELAELAQVVDEYYQVEALDPSKLPALQRQIWDMMTRAHLDADLKAMARQKHGDHVHEWDENVTEDGTPATLSVAIISIAILPYLRDNLAAGSDTRGVGVGPMSARPNYRISTFTRGSAVDPLQEQRQASIR